MTPTQPIDTQQKAAIAASKKNANHSSDEFSAKYAPTFLHSYAPTIDLNPLDFIF